MKRRRQTLQNSMFFARRERKTTGKTQKEGQKELSEKQSKAVYVCVFSEGISTGRKQGTKKKIIQKDQKNRKNNKNNFIKSTNKSYVY